MAALSSDPGGCVLSDQLATIATVVLVGLTVGMLALAVRRLRAETTVTRRTLWIGAGLPTLTAAAYLAVGAPPFHPLVIGIAGAGGLVVGAGIARLARIEREEQPFRVRQSGIALAAWVIAYVAAALAALSAIADAQAVAAVALAAATGIAVGAQLGLLVRVRAAT